MEEHAFKHLSNKRMLCWLIRNSSKIISFKKRKIWRVPRCQQCCFALVLYVKRNTNTCFGHCVSRRSHANSIKVGCYRIYIVERMKATECGWKRCSIKHWNDRVLGWTVARNTERLWTEEMWNADKTGLFWLTLPDKLLSVLKGRKGGKHAKQRITT